jgi:ParB/RepB/Spo0J family partition protein
MTETPLSTPAAGTAAMRELSLDAVAPSASNPRMTLDKDAFKELKRSIHMNGLLQPIAVRVAGDNFEIVGGHRRYLALRELAHENPNDPRFATIAALIVDVADVRIAAARLAENINRADLNAIEIAEGIADALESGMTDKELAESLGWQDRRNVYRYRQFHSAPAWLKEFATEVPVAAKKVDEHGAPVIDDVTDAQVHDIKKAPGLPLTHLLELLRLYNILRDADELELRENGGEDFKPRAERTVKKLARAAAQDGWSIVRLRAEIKRTKDPAPRTPASRNNGCVITDARASLDLKRPLARNERDDLAPRLTKALAALGYTMVVIGDSAA